MNRAPADSPAGNLAGDGLALHLTGDAEFERAFIKAPSSTFAATDGLGPAFNNNNCLACHTRDGRANHPVGLLSAPAATWTRLGADAGAFVHQYRTPCRHASSRRQTTIAHRCPCPASRSSCFTEGCWDQADSPFTGQADVHVRFEQAVRRFPDGNVIMLRRPLRASATPTHVSARWR
ncbi:MAG: di-heme oxidoredictase family protein [Burkholderiaceae bacterium]